MKETPKLNLSKSFGDNVIFSNVNFHIRWGEHVAIIGPNGSGKTTLIAEICDILKVTGNVSSPTFTIVNEYKDPDGKPVYHIDLYRIKDIREAVDAGIEECLFSGNICMLEWPELIEGMIEPPFISVHIDAAEDGTRTVDIDVVK